MAEYGLLVVRGKKAWGIDITAKSPMEARKRYYSSKHHERTEATVQNVTLRRRRPSRAGMFGRSRL